MLWKENWCFSGVDRRAGVGFVLHFSLRPTRDEGIFTAKFVLDGQEIRSVQRSPIPRDLTELVPVTNGALTLEVLEPLGRFHLTYSGDEVEADLVFEGRFPPWDFREGIRTSGETTVGERGRTVFHFPHYEQGMAVTGTVTALTGEHADRTWDVDGVGNRDHSWGWRDDHLFIQHHWLNANFDDRFVQGTSMFETTYPEPKHGGFESTAAGNVGVARIVPRDAYWLDEDNVPIPDLDRDCTYDLTLEDGTSRTVVAHLSEAVGTLALNFRSRDRTRAYQDIQAFVPFTLPDEGLEGAGVLEIGKRLRGPGVGDLI
jgi:hypothetical protein